MLIDGKKVKEARKALGKQGTVAKFAVAIDMSAPWVYALETAKSPVEIKEPLVRAMAKFLKVREGDLQV